MGERKAMEATKCRRYLMFTDKKGFIPKCINFNSTKKKYNTH